MATCAKAFSRVVRYDVRPNEHRTRTAESCMLLLIEFSKICSSMEYVLSVVVNQ